MVSTADPKPLTEHLELVFAFRKLFWLLCRQPANVISISGESEMGRRRVTSGEEIRQPVTVYVERLTAPRDDHRPGLPPNADAGTLAPHFQQVFEKWVDQGRRLPAVHQLFFLPQLGLPLLVEARFLNLAQAAEAYARTELGEEYMPQQAWAAGHYKTLVAAIPPQLDQDHRRAIESRLRFLNAYSFKKLVTLLVERTPAVADLIRCPSAFATHITNYRNHLVHLSGDAPSEADRHPPLQILVWYLEILLHIRFLSDLGFRSDELALAINDGFRFPERRLLTHYWSELPRHYRPSVG